MGYPTNHKIKSQPAISSLSASFTNRKYQNLKDTSIDLPQIFSTTKKNTKDILMDHAALNWRRKKKIKVQQGKKICINKNFFS